jgi:hypothetical protein
MECYVHPGTPAAGTCAGCGQPVCAACGEEIAGHRMCASCVAAAQARLAPEPSAPTFSSSAGAAPPALDLSGTAAVPATVVVPEKADPTDYAKALAFGAAAAVLGAVLWNQVTVWTGWQIGFIAVIVGAAVGWAVKTGAAGRQGEALPWLGAALAGFGIFLGYALRINELLSADAAYAQAPLLTRLPNLAVNTVNNMSLFSWLFVAFGVWEGWSIPRRAQH